MEQYDIKAGGYEIVFAQNPNEFTVMNYTAYITDKNGVPHPVKGRILLTQHDMMIHNDRLGFEWEYSSRFIIDDVLKRIYVKKERK